MNRIKLELIKQTTNVPIDQLKDVTQCNPYNQGWISQKFPVYPITINFYVSNPPFNRISLQLVKPFIPESIQFEGSSDSKQYFKFVVVTDFKSNGLSVTNLNQNHHYKYMRLKISQPKDDTKQNKNRHSNNCKQIWLRCIQLTCVTFYGSEYLYNLEKALQIDPLLFRLLELLQYRAIVSSKKAKNLSQKSEYQFISSKYYKDIEVVLKKVKQWKENPKKLSEEARSAIRQEIQLLVEQPFDLDDNEFDYDRAKIKQEVAKIQQQLYVQNLIRTNNLHKDVTDYFEKYWNKQIKQEYMRLLSSANFQDHGKALTNFWGEIKKMENFPENIEEATVMYLNYFLEYVHDPLKITAIKIMCIFFKNKSLTFDIYFAYQRLLFNLYCQLIQDQKEQLGEVALKCIYTLFEKVPTNLFIQALINPEHSKKLSTKLKKLEILEKITFRNVHIDARDRDLIVQYLIDILSIKQITLTDKNRAYNIIAYLASLYGKQMIMGKFEKLNTMITMSMQKAIDKKMLLIKAPKKEQDIPSCDFCGTAKESFRDPNTYDLHCFKQCKYLTPCKYCSQIVQIPELKKHYIENCKQRNLFKQCQDCIEVIIKANQDEHRKICSKALATKCALCDQKMDGKLKLKEHILKEGCPNNPR